MTQKILFAASEVFPYSMSGGLSKVVGALPEELAKHDDKEIVVVSPWYHTIKNSDTIEIVGVINVPFQQGMVEAEIGRTVENGVTHLFIKHDYFNAGDMYGQANDAERFAFFSRAVPEAAAHFAYEQSPNDPEKLFVPDVVHAHDWQTGFLPLILQQSDASLLPKGYADASTIFTIHRGEFFGNTVEPNTMLDWLRLPADTAKEKHFEYHGQANAVWAAMNADHITTVSPTYAKELTARGGYLGMDYHLCRDKMRGITNGIDVSAWNPKAAPFIKKENWFSADDVGGKERIKRDFCQEKGMDISRPLFGVISRISPEKGMQHIIDGIDEMVAQGWNIVIAGAAPKDCAELEVQLTAKMRQYPANVCFEQGWANESKSHNIFAASDATLIPSLSEPCGLTQMEAQRYGTAPIVRETGGLKDTVRDGVTGFSFKDYTKEAMLEATQRAMDTYQDTNAWQTIQTNCMRQDNSWSKSADAYQELYDAPKQALPVQATAMVAGGNAAHRQHGGRAGFAATPVLRGLIAV